MNFKVDKKKPKKKKNNKTNLMTMTDEELVDIIEDQENQPATSSNACHLLKTQTEKDEKIIEYETICYAHNGGR